MSIDTKVLSIYYNILLVEPSSLHLFDFEMLFFFLSEFEFFGLLFNLFKNTISLNQPSLNTLKLT